MTISSFIASLEGEKKQSRPKQIIQYKPIPSQNLARKKGKGGKRLLSSFLFSLYSLSSLMEKKKRERRREGCGSIKLFTFQH